MIEQNFKVVIIGSTGAIGSALINEFCHKNIDYIAALSRNLPAIKLKNVNYHTINITDEDSIIKTCQHITEKGPFDIIINASGMLHSDLIKPEKSLQSVSANNFQQLFMVNSIAPALVLKHFLPLCHDSSIIATLSARVGSISDNRLGGWYAYRASKAALNMIIKNASIEYKRKFKKSLVIGLHPGTVASDLSKPFSNNIPKQQIISPETSAKCLIKVIEELTPADTGLCFDWQGNEVLP